MPLGSWLGDGVEGFTISAVWRNLGGDVGQSVGALGGNGGVWGDPGGTERASGALGGSGGSEGHCEALGENGGL